MGDAGTADRARWMDQMLGPIVGKPADKVPAHREPALGTDRPRNAGERRMISTGPAAIKFAIFTVVTLLATALLALTIGNVTFRSTTGYKAMFTDAVNLNSGDEVRYAGRAGRQRHRREAGERHRRRWSSFKVEKERPDDDRDHRRDPLPQPDRPALPRNRRR